MSQITIHAFGPTRPWVRPGDALTVVVECGAPEGPVEAMARVTLLDLDVPVATVTTAVAVGEAPVRFELALLMPETTRHGYGLTLEIRSEAGVARACSAVEALDGWWESPRHAAVTSYDDSEAAAQAATDLAGWHVNVVQHYDWMWRHYRYRPPDGASVFEDALARTVSHDALRASIVAGHEAGIASLAYGSVYGAEPEYAEAHPDECVFDEAGEPLSLGNTFYINDVRPGSAWRARLLDEYVDAIRVFGFDGIHMDTYGPPHTAVAADGQPVDFAQLYPGLIAEAAALVARVAPDARVLFNCVEGFPLESVAPAPAAALYLELWPPDDSFTDVVRWIDRARALAAGRQVVIAAYAATFKGLSAEADRAAAFETVLLLGSVIAAAGAYHHALAEDGRLLVEGYYPAAVAMTPAEADELRALWRFTTRYVQLLSDPELRMVEPSGFELRDTDGVPVPWSSEPVAGAVWVRAVVTPAGRRVIQLVDLRDQADGCWTAQAQISSWAEGLRLTLPGVESIVAMSPWADDGDATPVTDDGGERRLPRFRRWLVLAER